MLIIWLVVCALLNLPSLASAIPPPASAACRISCTVANIIEWSEPSFPEINLGSLTDKKKQASGETVLTLYTNGDVVITADNSEAAELSFGSYTLLTKYKLKYGGSGLTQTGGRPTEWCSFDTFIVEGTDIAHVPTSGAVEVILSVRAAIEKISPENTGQYKATQTLTVCWKS